MGTRDREDLPSESMLASRPPAPMGLAASFPCKAPHPLRLHPLYGIRSFPNSDTFKWPCSCCGASGRTLAQNTGDLTAPPEAWDW